MRNITLTDDHYSRLAEEASNYSNEGVSTVYENMGNDDFYVSFDIETEGYSEDDYFNGTGGYVVTSAVCHVTDFSQTLFVDEDTEIPVEFDINRFERDVEKLLIT